MWSLCYCLSVSLSEFVFLVSVLTSDVLLGLCDVILLCCPGEDGGLSQCSGVAGHSLHLVHRSGENQRGKSSQFYLYIPISQIICKCLCAFVIIFLHKALLKVSLKIQ